MFVTPFEVLDQGRGSCPGTETPFYLKLLHCEWAEGCLFFSFEGVGGGFVCFFYCFDVIFFQIVFFLTCIKCYGN